MIRLPQGGHQATGDRGAGRFRVDVAVPPVWQQDRELVTTEPRHDVLRTEHVEQPRADLLQQPVSDVMAERVVDLLEPVQVQQHHRERLPALRRRPELLVDASAEQQPVRQPGQRVMLRLVLVQLRLSRVRPQLRGDPRDLDGLLELALVRPSQPPEHPGHHLADRDEERPAADPVADELVLTRCHVGGKQGTGEHHGRQSGHRGTRPAEPQAREHHRQVEPVRRHVVLATDADAGCPAQAEHEQ